MKLFSILLLCLFSLQTHALSLDVSDGETSEIEVYDGDNKPVEIIYMHGKNSKPVFGPAEELFYKLSGSGYTVYSAEMPWGRNKYRGTQKTADAIIEQLVVKIKAKGKQAVLMGHSMGGSYAIIYAAKFSDSLAGVVPIAFAHVPQINERFKNETAESVAKANKLLRAGKGKDYAGFSDLNMGESYEIDSTAEYYKSFYDPTALPDASILIKEVKTPVLWISGKRDRLTEIYLHDELYEKLPSSDKNKHEYIKGNHISVLKFSGDIVIDWLGGL